jgi:hypothetical protein
VAHGPLVNERKLLDLDNVEFLREELRERFSPEEVCEILKLTVDDLFEMFRDEILEVDWEEWL